MTTSLPTIVPIGLLLRERRIALGLNPNGLGIATGLTDGRIVSIEQWTPTKAIRDVPLESEVAKLAGALGTTLPDIIRFAHARGAQSIAIGTRQASGSNEKGNRHRQPLLPAISYVRLPG